LKGIIVIDLRKTSDNKFSGVIRIILGMIFFMTGVMKLFIPMFTEAWMGQLVYSGIPLVAFNFWFVPIMETVLGILLLRGIYSRIVSLAIMPIMLVAFYVHVIVDNPALFPLQPELPVVPVIVIMMAVVILKNGGGSWSEDLKHTIKKVSS
jgi:putative oxidoreductase